MKVTIESAAPDGLTVSFEEKFYFDTWDEAFQFIRNTVILSSNPKMTLHSSEKTQEDTE